MYTRAQTYIRLISDVEPLPNARRIGFAESCSKGGSKILPFHLEERRLSPIARRTNVAHHDRFYHSLLYLYE